MKTSLNKKAYMCVAAHKLQKITTGKLLSWEGNIKY